MSLLRWSLVLLVLVVMAFASPEVEGVLTIRRSTLRARARQEAADRLRRGFQNSALATARGFGKRTGPELQHSDTKGHVGNVVPVTGAAITGVVQLGRLASVLNRNAGKSQIPNHSGRSWMGEAPAERKPKNRLNSGEPSDDERYPVWMVSELVSSSPSLATSLVARFLDQDEDGFVTPHELLAMM